jgi:hypothetical protein
MISRRGLTAFIVVVLVVAAAMPATQAALPEREQKQDKKTERKREIPIFLSGPNEGDSSAGKPGLWRDPGAIESLNLFYGPGGQSGAPDPAIHYTY